MFTVMEFSKIKLNFVTFGLIWIRNLHCRVTNSHFLSSHAITPLNTCSPWFFDLSWNIAQTDVLEFHSEINYSGWYQLAFALLLILVHIGLYCYVSCSEMIEEALGWNIFNFSWYLYYLLYVNNISLSSSKFCDYVISCHKKPAAVLNIVLNWISLGLSNWGLKYVTVSFFTMAKSSSILFMVAFALLLHLERWRPILVISAGLIAFGLFLFTWRFICF